MKKIIFAVILALSLSVVISLAQDTPVGTIVAIQGKVSALRGGRLIPLKFKEPVFKGDTIVSEKGSKAKILFNNESTATIAENTKLEIKDVTGSKDSKDRSTVLNVANGIGRFVAGKKFLDPGSKFEVTTPTAVAGVRSTDFFVIFIGNKAIFVTNEGAIGVSNISPQLLKEILVNAGFQTEVDIDKFAMDAFLADSKFLEELFKAVEILQGQDGILLSREFIEELFKRANGETILVFRGFLPDNVFNDVTRLTRWLGGGMMDFNGIFTGGNIDWNYAGIMDMLTGTVNNRSTFNNGTFYVLNVDDAWIGSTFVTGGAFSSKAKLMGGQYVGNVTGTILGNSGSGTAGKFVFTGQLTADRTGKTGTVTLTGGQLYQGSNPILTEVSGGKINFR